MPVEFLDVAANNDGSEATPRSAAPAAVRGAGAAVRVRDAGVMVPAEFGGADVRTETLAEIFRLLASADTSLAQIPQSHFVYVNVLRRYGDTGPQEFFFGQALVGKRFGNARSEAGTSHVRDIRTRLARRPDGSYVLDGVGAGTALVGSHDEVAERIAEYHRLGIDEFVLSGYPHLEEAYWFGEGVLPRLEAQGLWTHPFRSATAARTVAQVPLVERESARVARIP